MKNKSEEDNTRQNQKVEELLTKQSSGRLTETRIHSSSDVEVEKVVTRAVESSKASISKVPEVAQVEDGGYTLTETDLFKVGWHLGRSLESSVKCMAKFLMTMNGVQVFESSSSEEICIKFPNKKTLQTILKLSSQNETNSLVKLKNAAPKMELVGWTFFKGKFGLTAAKSRATKRVLEDELARVGAVEVEERTMEC